MKDKDNKNGKVKGKSTKSVVKKSNKTNSNKNKNTKTNTKKNAITKYDKKSIIILIAFFLVLAVVVGVLVIMNKDKRNDNNNGLNNEPQAIIVDESILSYLKLNSLPEEYYGYFYQKDKYNNKSIENKVKIYMAIRKVLSTKEYDNTKITEINESDVSKSLKEIFGSNTVYKHESIDGNNCSYTNFKYDKSKRMYIQGAEECIETATDTILSEIVDKKVSDKQVEIYEKVGFVELSYNLENKKLSYNIYNDINKKNKVATVDEYGISTVKDSLNTYKYTFIKDKENYYLNSIELVK